MITWLQVLLQKHHKVVFSILLFVIIVAFVFTIGSSIPFLGDRNIRSVETKNVYGFNLQDPHTADYLAKLANYESVCTRGQFAEKEQLAQLIYIKAFLLGTAEHEFGLREVSDDYFKQYVHSLPIFSGADGKFSVESYNELIKNLRMTEQEMVYILQKNALASKVSELLMGSGYALQAEAKFLDMESNSTWDIEVAQYSMDKFNPEIAVTDEKLQAYYNLSRQKFEVPPAVGMDVVFFASDKFIDTKLTFTDKEIEDNYNERISTYTGEDGKVSPLAEVRDSVIADLRNTAALSAAMEASENMLEKVYSGNIKHNSEAYKQILADSKMEIFNLPLIRDVSDEGVSPNIPADVIEEGLKRTAASFFGDPVEGEKGAWVVFFREGKDAYIPSFEEIKSTVETDFRHQEKQRLFSEMGAKASADIQAAVKEGKSFSDAATSAGFIVSPINKFSFANRAFQTQTFSKYLNVIYSFLPKMKMGDVSKMSTQMNSGYILYIKNYEASKADVNSPEFKELEKRTAMMMKYYSNLNILNEKVSKLVPRDTDFAE